MIAGKSLMLVTVGAVLLCAAALAPETAAPKSAESAGTRSAVATQTGALTDDVGGTSVVVRNETNRNGATGTSFEVWGFHGGDAKSKLNYIVTLEPKESWTFSGNNSTYFDNNLIIKVGGEAKMRLLAHNPFLGRPFIRSYVANPSQGQRNLDEENALSAYQEKSVETDNVAYWMYRQPDSAGNQKNMIVSLWKIPARECKPDKEGGVW